MKTHPEWNWIETKWNNKINQELYICYNRRQSSIIINIWINNTFIKRNWKYNWYKIWNKLENKSQNKSTESQPQLQIATNVIDINNRMWQYNN